MTNHEIAVCGVPFGTAEEKEALEKLKKAGATSVQIYVHWRLIEGEERGRFDWSYYDRQVKLIKDAGLKWVPFIILGPAYSTPDWWKKEEGHCGMVCLEHGVAGEIESIWNPLWRKELTRFLEAFAEHYIPWDVIESVQPGISGDYGEAIYPAIGSHPGVYHTHYGYWCMDKYALKSFRETLAEKYGDIDSLNKAWRSVYADFEEIVPFKRHKAPSRTAQFDFMMWYKNSMTDYDEFWMKECQRIFKGIPVYMCTGGAEEPYLGADFAEQARASAKYGGGIRLTNEGNLFYENYDDTVHCVTACKYYGAYMGLEPVGPMRPYGVTARTFGSAAYGNRQIFHYYGNLFDGSGDEGAKRLSKYLDLIKERSTSETVAVFLPLDMVWVEASKVPANIKQALNFVRRQYETAVVSETLIEDGILDKIKVLIMLGTEYTRGNVLEKIAQWVKNGGTLITDMRCTDIEGDFVPAFDEALGFTENSIYYGGITDFEPTLLPWSSDFNEKDRCCNKIAWGHLAQDAVSMLTMKPGADFSQTNHADSLSCAFYHEYGNGRAVFYCGPLDLIPSADPMFGEYHIYEHILSDMLREFAGVKPLGTNGDEIARARVDGKILIHKHDEIYFSED